MQIQFKNINFRKKSLDQIKICNQIIEEYQNQNLRLTLRQLYYQLVTQNIISNTEKSYSHLSTLISNARLVGITDWSAIEDRVRMPRRQSEFEDLEDLISVAVQSYRLPRWQGQEYYAELWVEKDALAGVLSPLASEFHVTMMVNRGYSSQSAMFDSSTRFLGKGTQKPILFYLGDLDPSGEDMVRDIKDRLIMFGVPNICVKKLALTIEQVHKYNPPPNPAKKDDPRAKEYILKHGSNSWEVDALPPDVLSKIICKAFNKIIDKKKMDIIIQKEETDKRSLRKLAGFNR